MLTSLTPILKALLHFRTSFRLCPILSLSHLLAMIPRALGDRPPACCSPAQSLLPRDPGPWYPIFSHLDQGQTSILVFLLPLLFSILCAAPRAILSNKQSGQTTPAIFLRISLQNPNTTFLSLSCSGPWLLLPPDNLPLSALLSSSLNALCPFLLWVFAHIFPLSGMFFSAFYLSYSFIKSQLNATCSEKSSLMLLDQIRPPCQCTLYYSLVALITIFKHTFILGITDLKPVSTKSRDQLYASL